MSEKYGGLINYLDKKKKEREESPQLPKMNQGEYGKFLQGSNFGNPKDDEQKRKKI